MASPESEHRRRIHEMLLALIGRVEPLDLQDESNGEPSSWLERNRRVVKRYQALVHGPGAGPFSPGESQDSSWPLSRCSPGAGDRWLCIAFPVAAIPWPLAPITSAPPRPA
ncbi:MAG: hypothetical protein ERJ68_07720 [Aphanocapsa feldmannii 277cI]|uniref:Uncharacterized protein n=1 Tax=Aphanocapsa feldmannii 277cI TaxID=2507554 RepID=A0A524RS88_9CHRO|nr:MAG: hypothetical protein ERJ68_07720 [Aphanocapsa feldmannii 277cI]